VSPLKYLVVYFRGKITPSWSNIAGKYDLFCGSNKAVVGGASVNHPNRECLKPVPGGPFAKGKDSPRDPGEYSPQMVSPPGGIICGAL